jgi:thymidylate synthase (FAD)
VNVLDKGSLDLMLVHGDDKLVVNAARVSFANEDWMSEFKPNEDGRLIAYLGKHKHVSPFYHPQLTFRVKAPISVQRQAFKHKIGTAENSESTRYVVVKDEYYTPQTFHRQSSSNKQGAGEAIEDQELAHAYFDRAMKSSFSIYDALIRMGVAKEEARGVLPLDTYTSWVWTMSLMAVCHFIQLRTEEHAQWSIRQYGNAMRELVAPKFPQSLKALLSVQQAPSQT